MRYPEFLSKGDLIGICAPSAGVGRKEESFDASLKAIHKEGWRTRETASVRLNDMRGGDAPARGKELNELFRSPDVKMVMAASGGDFLDEMLPYTDWDTLSANPKWLMGYSDPTGLLYPYTTLYDVASLYGFNAGSFDMITYFRDEKDETYYDPDSFSPEYLENALRFLAGEMPKQHSFPAFMKGDTWQTDQVAFNAPSAYQASAKRIQVSGRCIGGCIDVLKDMIGTVYDGTKTFKNRYAGDGLIWYFDNFSLSAESLYRTFLQMRYAGWIDPETTKAVLMGRTLIESSDTGMSYEEGIRRAFPDIPVIWEADVGHTVPHFFMVNGAMLDLGYENGKCRLKFRLE